MTESKERWWVIAESDLADALRSVEAGADPSVVMLELIANSDREDLDGGDA